MRFIPTIQDRKLQELLCRTLPPPRRFPSAISRPPASAASRSRAPASTDLGERGSSGCWLTWLGEPGRGAKERSFPPCVCDPKCIRWGSSRPVLDGKSPVPAV